MYDDDLLNWNEFDLWERNPEEHPKLKVEVGYNIFTGGKAASVHAIYGDDRDITDLLNADMAKAYLDDPEGLKEEVKAYWDTHNWKEMVLNAIQRVRNYSAAKLIENQETVKQCDAKLKEMAKEA